jgi:hypothetical protein
LNLERGDRRLLLGAGAVFLLLVVVGMIFASNRGVASELPTTYSTASGGAMAAYLLLQESGYNVDRWRRPPGELPNSAGTTFILAEPGGAPTSEEREGVSRFVNNGGRLIVTGMFSGIFLPESGVTFDPSGSILWKKARAIAPSPITRAAPEITLEPSAYWKVPPLAVPLYGEPARPAVVRLGAGKGEILWWASPTPLTNAGMREPGNLEFFLASVGSRENTRILFDEYFHGYRDRDHVPTVQSTSAPLGWLGLQLALLTVVTLLTYSRRSGPIWMPAPESRLSPLEFVETLGNLYERANAAGVAVDICYQRFRYSLARRLGLAGNVTADALEQTARERFNFAPAGFGETLRACEAAHSGHLEPRDALRLVRALYDYAATLQLYRSSFSQKQ